MTESDEFFERLTRLAAKSLDVSQARICLDEQHRRFTGAPSRDAICERAVNGSDDAILTSPMTLRGTPIGVFVAADERPRKWSKADVELLGYFARAAVAQIELQMAIREAEAKRPHARSDRPRVLIAEDDPSMRRLIAHTIEDDGYAIDEATNGRQALDVMEHKDIDLLILDLVMPDLSGWDVLQHRVSDPRLREVQVIVVSARRGPDVARAVAFGIFGLLPKPFEPADLRDMVHTCLGERRTVAAAR